MAPTARGRYNASRSNQTAHYGIMGGLAPSTNVPRMFRLRRATKRQTIPSMPIPGLAFMLQHNLLSRNPAGSGGIGLSRVLVGRSMGPCDCSPHGADPEFPKNEQARSPDSAGTGRELTHEDTDMYEHYRPPRHITVVPRTGQ